MDCDLCKRPVGDCRCPDMDTRLRAVRRSGAVMMPWCGTCDRHLARCRCRVFAPGEPPARVYECLGCGHKRPDPLDMHFCVDCDGYCCPACRPAHDEVHARELAMAGFVHGGVKA